MSLVPLIVKGSPLSKAEPASIRIEKAVGVRAVVIILKRVILVIVPSRASAFVKFVFVTVESRRSAEPLLSFVPVDQSELFEPDTDLDSTWQ